MSRRDQIWVFDPHGDLVVGSGPWAGVAWIEVANVLEHRRRDPAGALDACTRADRIAERARFTGGRLPLLEADLARRTRKVAKAGCDR